MSVKITIPNTSSDYLTFGSANTPDAAKIGGYEDSTGNGHLELYTTASGTSTERMRIDASGNVGIGTSSLSNTPKLNVSGSIIATNATIDSYTYDQAGIDFVASTKVGRIFGTSSNTTGGILTFVTGANGTNAERMRIDSSGNVLVGTTTASARGTFQRESNSNSALATRTDANAYVGVNFLNASAAQAGYIYVNASTVAYNTTSDYRLKENVQPMVGALDTVSQLKPVTYNWIADGSHGQGFIAHELQAVVPDCVTGEKDAVDEEGNPIYQGIDTSFLVATLTAAIQELKAELDTVKSELATLKGTV